MVEVFSFMPTYEYLCKTCSHRFETWQKMIDEPLTICPECGSSIRRVLFPPGIVFKGSGFYKTDHNHSSTVSGNGHEPETSESTKSEEGGTKADSKKPAEGSTPSSGNDKTKGQTSESTATSSSTGTNESKAPAAAGKQ